MVLAEGEMMTRRVRDLEPAAWAARIPPAAALTKAGIPSGWIIAAIATGVGGGVAAGIVAANGSNQASSQTSSQTSSQSPSQP